MEENIKILEELIKNANVENADMNDVFGGEHVEAIEHLLKAYKELKEENIDLKAKADFKLYISGMRNGKELLQKTLADYNDLSIKVLKLQSMTSYTIDDLIDLFLKGYTLQKDYIPVSLVKEKLEELKNENYQISLNSEVAFDSGIMRNNYKIKVLQELLGDEK